MTRKNAAITKAPARPKETTLPGWIERFRGASSADRVSESFRVDGLEVVLTAVDPALVRWVLRYLQPLSTGSGEEVEGTCTFSCLYDDDLVSECTRYLSNGGNIDFLGRGKDGATLTCAQLTDDLTLYCNGAEGIVRLADFKARTVTMVFASRSRRPALDFSRIVRDVVTGYLINRGWSLYHAGAVDTPEGILAIVGNPGAGKTTLILALVSDGARYVANEQLFVRANGDGFEVLGYPLAVAVGLGTALQFPKLGALIETPDLLLYPRRRFSLSRIRGTPRENWPALDDKLQLLPEEIDHYVGPSGMVSGGRLRALVVPRISKLPVTPKIEALNEDTSYDILADNLLEPLHDQSRFALSRMMTSGLRGEDDDDQLLDKLCTLDALRFDYSLSASDNGSGFTDMLLNGLPSKA